MKRPTSGCRSAGGSDEPLRLFRRQMDPLSVTLAPNNKNIFFSIESLENVMKPDTDVEQEVLGRSSRGKTWPCLCRKGSLFDFRASELLSLP